LAPRKILMHKKARQRGLKWESLYDAATYALDIHVSIGHSLSAPVFNYSLLLNVCESLRPRKFLLLEPKGRGVGPPYCEYSKA
jgi:hypothetical protein